jgi:putative flippase GtrA
MTTLVAAEQLSPNPTLPLRARLARCLSVSVVSTTVSLATLVLSTVVFGIPATIANIVATAVATFPSYHLNRRWTWGRRDRSDPWRETLPFWFLAFSGLALSTIAVGFADSWAAAMHLAPSLRTATVLVAHLSGFGALWIVQFIVLDRVLFGRRTPDGSRVGGGDRH